MCHRKESMYEYYTLNGTKINPRKDVWIDFKMWGLKARSHSLYQYEAGKRELNAMDLTPDEYARTIQRLANWVGV